MRPYFYVRILGGKWTKKWKGKVADAALGKARTYAKSWCELYNMPKQKAYYYSKYGRIEAHWLAEQYCKRASHFFDLWLEGDDPADGVYMYTDEELNSYQGDLEFVTWVQAEDEGDAYDEGVKLQNLVPTNPAKPA